MIETATGVVLRTRLLTETSLIVLWLTPAFGRLATVAKGARRPKSPLRGKLDLFYLADFSFKSQPGAQNCTICAKSACAKPIRRCARNWPVSRQAAYCAALGIEQSSETETPLPALFDLAASSDFGRIEAVVVRHEVGNANPAHPEVFYTQSWNTNRFLNPSVRTVEDFDPQRADPSQNDYLPADGSHPASEKVFLWGRPNFLGVGKEHLDARLYFAFVDMPAYSETGAFAGSRSISPASRRGSRCSRRTPPTRRPSISTAAPATPAKKTWDYVEQMASVSRSVAALDDALRGAAPFAAVTGAPQGTTSYSSSNEAVGNPEGAIHVRFATNPWGPWSEPAQLLVAGDPTASPPTVEYADDGMLHDTTCSAAHCAPGEKALAYVVTPWGWLYGPSIVDPSGHPRAAGAPTCTSRSRPGTRTARCCSRHASCPKRRSRHRGDPEEPLYLAFMARALVIHAHPYSDRSRAGRALVEAVQAMDDVEVRSLYVLYPDFWIDVVAEQRALVEARVVVWQCPVFWYSVPALLSLWVREGARPRLGLRGRRPCAAGQEMPLGHHDRSGVQRLSTGWHARLPVRVVRAADGADRALLRHALGAAARRARLAGHRGRPSARRRPRVPPAPRGAPGPHGHPRRGSVVSDHGLLFDTMVYLAAAVVFVPLASRFRLGSVLGYLIAGCAMAPGASGSCATSKPSCTLPSSASC